MNHPDSVRPRPAAGNRAAGSRLAAVLAAVVLAAGCSQEAAPGGASVAGAGGAKARPAAAPDGARLYAAYCQTCHGPDGRGMPGVFPSLAGSAVANGDPAALALWVLKGQRPASMAAGKSGAGEMPSFAWMKSADAAAVLTYVRASFGNSAPPVEAEAVDAALGH